MGLLDDMRAARRAAGRRPTAPAAADAADGMVPALLFIPDISGFTRFIQESGSVLAPQLIADLLEILVEANTLNMEVSEIQGDAILFYRLGPPPTVQEVVTQCRRIFLDFQNYVRLVERDLDSELSAALRSHDLTIKIIVHFGRVSVAQIRQFTKLMGRDVIVVHRLLKNNVTGNEYILLSDGYLETQPAADVARSFGWTRLLRGTCLYDYLGEICYRYAYLSPLRLLLNDAGEGVTHRGGDGSALKVMSTVRVPAAYALRVLSNFRLRAHWMPGVSEVQYDLTKAGRLGTSYKVKLNRGQIDFQTVQRFEDADRIEYVEKISLFRLFPNSFLFCFIEAVDARSCLVTLEFRYGYIASPRPLIRFGQRQRMRRFMGQSSRQFATLCERMQRAGRES
ncbi:DUF2652 domain-containing protein [Hymenobacter chitinivorans]|uniref:Uncharacterized protein DUF2652 n=1 Tax=Hymenobacter chitinivorans DSM 11115 TaxID=1121954 RepID=A0A2M9B8Y1_9BACT|nr:DUF2652 domain-containing protein [Hymenobacter chitinivorans]PJJ54406.1 uncharacterized protein DUF2652 [Hymenobacter chitinivorans DSM 11115]